MVSTNKVDTLDLVDTLSITQFILELDNTIAFRKPNYYRICDAVFISDILIERVEELNGKMHIITQPGENYTEITDTETAHLVFQNFQKILFIERHWGNLRADIIQQLFEVEISEEEVIDSGYVLPLLTMLSRETQQELNSVITQHPDLHEWIIRIQSRIVFDKDGKESLHPTLETSLWCIWAVQREEFCVFKYITGMLPVVSRSVYSEVKGMESSNKEKYLNEIRNKLVIRDIVNR